MSEFKIGDRVRLSKEGKGRIGAYPPRFTDWESTITKIGCGIETLDGCTWALDSSLEIVPPVSQPGEMRRYQVHNGHVCEVPDGTWMIKEDDFDRMRVERNEALWSKQEQKRQRMDAHVLLEEARKERDEANLLYNAHREMLAKVQQERDEMCKQWSEKYERLLGGNDQWRQQLSKVETERDAARVDRDNWERRHEQLDRAWVDAGYPDPKRLIRELKEAIAERDQIKRNVLNAARRMIGEMVE